MPRNIKYIVVHTTGTVPTATVESIKRYWREELGWKSPGYHIIIDRFGHSTVLAPLSAVTNGVAGYNSVSIHISYIGGADKKGKTLDTRTEAQKIVLRETLVALRKMYPNAIIQGHRDFPNVKKACPCFDAKIEYADI